MPKSTSEFLSFLSLIYVILGLMVGMSKASSIDRYVSGPCYPSYQNQKDRFSSMRIDVIGSGVMLMIVNAVVSIPIFSANNIYGFTKVPYVYYLSGFFFFSLLSILINYRKRGIVRSIELENDKPSFSLIAVVTDRHKEMLSYFKKEEGISLGTGLLIIIGNLMFYMANYFLVLFLATTIIRLLK